MFAQNCEPLAPTMKPRQTIKTRPHRRRSIECDSATAAEKPAVHATTAREPQSMARRAKTRDVINCARPKSEPTVEEPDPEADPDHDSEGAPAAPVVSLKDSAHHKRNRRHLIQLQKEAKAKQEEQEACAAKKSKAAERLARSTGLARVSSRFMQPKQEVLPEGSMPAVVPKRENRKDNVAAEPVLTKEQIQERRDLNEALQRKQKEHLEALASRRAAAKELDEEKKKKKEMMVQHARDQVLKLRQRNMNILAGHQPEEQQEESSAEGAPVGGTGIWAAFELSQKAIDKYVSKRRGKTDKKDQGFAESKAERSRLLRLRRLPEDTKFFIIHGGQYQVDEWCVTPGDDRV